MKWIVIDKLIFVLHRPTYVGFLYYLLVCFLLLLSFVSKGFLLTFVCLIITAQVATPRMDMTLAELQEMAARQQQQIEAQQQLLASKVHLEELQDERGEMGNSRDMDTANSDVK